jgi:hypothetical protein
VTAREQDASIGRLVCEFIDARREYVALTAVLRRNGHQLCLCGASLLDGGNFVPDMLPGTDDLRPLVDRAVALKLRINELRQSLRRIGLPLDEKDTE